jgi:hypothetical protein
MTTSSRHPEPEPPVAGAEVLRRAPPQRADLGLAKNQVSHRIYVTDAKGIVLLDSSGQALGKDYSRWNDVYLTLRGQYGARSTRSDPTTKAPR